MTVLRRTLSKTALELPARHSSKHDELIGLPVKCSARNTIASGSGSQLPKPNFACRKLSVLRRTNAANMPANSQRRAGKQKSLIVLTISLDPAFSQLQGNGFRSSSGPPCCAHANCFQARSSRRFRGLPHSEVEGTAPLEVFPRNTSTKPPENSANAGSASLLVQRAWTASALLVSGLPGPDGGR